MQSYVGKSVYRGIAVGPVLLVKQQEISVKHKRIAQPEVELARVREAILQAKEQLRELYKKAKKEVGEESAAIFEVHQLLLEDENYTEAIDRLIRTECVNAEYAVAMTGDRVAEVFAGLEDEYMKERAADVKDISNRLLHCLSGGEEFVGLHQKPAILVAEDLSPSETVQMDQDKILALVTVQGSVNSHTAILARMRNLPAVIGVPLSLETVSNGMLAIVDGFTGTVILEPTEEQLREAEKKQQQEWEQERLLRTLKGKESITADGRRIRLYANIGSVSDIGDVLEQDAEGIGLFRSEFLYLGRRDLPSEEEQFQAYQQTLQRMAGKEVVIRTLDLGADKQAEALGLEKEDNPAMGYRAIRICLKQPELFRVQLRALLRAAVFGRLSILYPMIISTEEVKKIQEMVRGVQQELEQAQIPCRLPEQGIMIETPAAVLMSAELAQLVDFFSIGTNDLTQYTLAIDRQNARLDDFYDPHHPAILRMIQMTVENAHRYGKRVAICGELGADPTLTEAFVCMGVDELSVAPSQILRLRRLVRSIGRNG